MQHPSLAIPIESAADSRSTSTRTKSPRSTLRVRCSCATEPEFVQRYAADISARGMFLRTGQQLPLGARVRFELLLQSGRCALGGVGRVAWLRAADPALGRGAGAAIAFERLRRGDRAVIERMDLTRGELPSRFDQPDLPLATEAPRGVELAKLLFADLGGRPDDSSAFLSADLSTELGDGGWKHGRPANAELVADLAEQLEPGLDGRESARTSGGEEELDVELCASRFEPEPGDAEAQPQHSTVRPAALSPVQGRPSRPTPAPALRARIQALRPAANSGGTAPAADGTIQEPRAQRSARGAHRPQLAAKRSAPVDRDVSTDTLERAAGVPAALARAAVELAGAPPSAVSATAASATAPASASVSPSHATAAPAPARPVPAPAAQAAAASPVAASTAPAAVAAPAAPRPRRSSSWPVGIMLCVIIIAASAVTYLALSDQLPSALSLFGR